MVTIPRSVKVDDQIEDKKGKPVHNPRRRLVNGPEYEQNGEHMVCSSLRNFFFFLAGRRRGAFFTEQVKITPRECILRVTRPNGK